MHKDDIIRMAREAGFQRTKMHNALEQFAYIVAAAEREACAKLCENIHEIDCNVDTFYSEIYVSAIRERGQHGD